MYGKQDFDFTVCLPYETLAEQNMVYEKFSLLGLACGKY